jgi:hypothetical protein
MVLPFKKNSPEEQSANESAIYSASGKLFSLKG